jgi:hypothetical protein
VESLDVKASVAERNLGQIRLERRATGQAVAKCEPGNLENEPCLKRMAGYLGEPSPSDLGEGIRADANHATIGERREQA